jgi:hypothetical protein
MAVNYDSRGEDYASHMTIREVVLIEIFKSLLLKGGNPGIKVTLDKAQEATAYYLQAIEKKPEVVVTKLSGHAPATCAPAACAAPGFQY